MKGKRTRFLLVVRAAIAFSAAMSIEEVDAHRTLPAQRPVNLLIRNPEVIDGTETKGFLADLAIAGSHIVAIQKEAKVSARLVIDAAGLVLAPGLIDLPLGIWWPSIGPTA